MSVTLDNLSFFDSLQFLNMSVEKHLDNLLKSGRDFSLLIVRFVLSDYFILLLLVNLQCCKYINENINKIEYQKVIKE